MPSPPERCPCHHPTEPIGVDLDGLTRHPSPRHRYPNRLAGGWPGHVRLAAGMLAGVRIGRLGEGDVVAVRGLVDEYLGDVAGFERCYRWRADTVLVAHDGERCVGVCYASPSDGQEIGLAGIAVDDAVSGHGIGSRLLAAFEEGVATAGFRRVSLGSAAGYAEHFYEKNGYQPIEYVVTVPSGVPVERLVGLPITRIRRRGDVTLVNVISTAGRDPKAKAAVLTACRGTAVNIIYRKQLA